MPGLAVLLTGPLAAGKTVVAGEIVAAAAELGLPVAAIDLDWLGWATGGTLGVNEMNVKQALPGLDVVIVRVDASRTTLEQRVRTRDSGAELEEHLAELDSTARRTIEVTPPS